MAAMAQLRYSPLAGHYGRSSNFAPIFFDNSSISFPKLRCTGNLMLNPDSQTKFHLPCAGGGGGGGNGGNGGWSSGGGSSDESKSSLDGFGPIEAFVNGWRSRVAADPQFGFKVLMEELASVSLGVLGEMVSRNSWLNELDFVFSTVVAGSIMKFVLVYLLAPTMSSTQILPSVFTGFPTGHMFEPGSYTLLSRLGTFVLKGTLFSAVGFAAGLFGAALSNRLISMRKKMDPNFETLKKPQPPVLNATTWAIHMGLSSNFRYQILNRIEFVLDKECYLSEFKSVVVVLRCLNNILGGVSFWVLAKSMGLWSAMEGEARE